MKKLVLILGNQLFPWSYYKKWQSEHFFMAEDHGLCTYTKHHKQKIQLFLVAMRHYRDDLKTQKVSSDYFELQTTKESYEAKLLKVVKAKKIEEIVGFEIEDHFFAQRIQNFCKKYDLKYDPLSSPMFNCSREDFSAYLGSGKKPFMKTFYESQRRKHNILMKGNEPVGGQFSFDEENRKKLPKKIDLPKEPKISSSKYLQPVCSLIEKHFPTHPGTMDRFVWPTTRKESLKILDEFLQNKMENFGTYQDAISDRDDFLFHSLISPALNLGLITPDDVIKKCSKLKDAPLNSIEGFIRQVIGWREFVRGIYHNYSDQMNTVNHWGHHRKGKEQLYNGNSSIPPLDDAVNKALRTGYCHHIERLMILANFYNLCELDPKEIYTWFMNHFVDSSDWVMEANVYGMGLTSDGGIFATKPYISGSNYIRKMSDYKPGPWCDIWDGLYWRFIEKKREKIASNYRMSMMVRMLDKLDPEKKKRIFSAAEQFLEEYTFT